MIKSAGVLALAIGLSATLSACGYDYMQRTDRVGYSAGNAVKANLERETINPSRKSMDSTAQLGKNGVVVPVDGSASSSIDP